VVLSAGLGTDSVRQSLAMTSAGASQAQRDYNALHTAGYITFVAAAERGQAIAKAKRQLCFIMRNQFLQDNIAASGLNIDQQAIIAAMSARDFDRAQNLIPDEAVDRFAVAGTAAECCDKLAKYADAGLKELVLLVAGTLADQRQGLQVIREMKSVTC